MRTIIEYLEQAEKKYGKKIAVIEENRTCTYSELVNSAKSIGTTIISKTSVRKPIPVLMEKGINALAVFFGAVYAGDFYVFLNPDLPENRLKDIFEILESDILITDQEHVKIASKISNKFILFEDIKDTQIDEMKLEKIKQQSMSLDPLYVNFTSGSTGKPKGVVVDNKSVIEFIDIFTDKFHITDKDIIANQAPFDFDVSVKDIYSAISKGATLVIVPKKMFSKPAELLDYLCDNKVTTLIWAVSALCLITTFHGLDYKVPETVNKILFSGEVMPLKHLKIWIEHLPKAMFVNLYGPTEVTCNCTYYIIDNNKEYENKIPIGVAFDNKEIILLDEKNNIVSNTNTIGEICVRSNTLALGYYGEKELSDKSFIQNPLNDKYRDLLYKTGDLGYYDQDNNLVFSGRKDFQIKHQGHRIELEEIQIAMEKIDEIKRACVIYNEEKSRIYGFYIGDIDKKEIHSKLLELLPVYMIPNVLRKVEEFPLNKNGKIDRKALMEM